MPTAKRKTREGFSEFPEFFNGYLLSVGRLWPGDMSVIQNFWLVHPNGKDYFGPYDDRKEAKKIAKSLPNPMGDWIKFDPENPPEQGFYAIYHPLLLNRSPTVIWEYRVEDPYMPNRWYNERNWPADGPPTHYHPLPVYKRKKKKS